MGSAAPATHGPAPKRSDQRAGHRAKADRPDQVAMPGPVKIPPARSWWCEEAKAWYRSLKISGQSRFFEPSDWEYARLLCRLLTDELGMEKRADGEGPGIQRRSTEMLKGILAAMNDLGTTEGSRRRLRIEIVREQQNAPADAARAVVVELRERLGAGG